MKKMLRKLSRRQKTALSVFALVVGICLSYLNDSLGVIGVPIMFGMASNAFSGVGTQFLRGDGDSSSEIFSAIAEINSIDGPNKSRGTIDVTSLDSLGGYKEFIASFREAGEISLEMNFTRDGYIDMNTDFEDEAKHNYQIILPDIGNTTLDFAGLVTSLGMSVPKEDKVTAKVTIKISGQVTLTS